MALKQAGIKNDPRLALLDKDRPPKGFEYLWLIFWEIRSGASEGASGVRITWRDLVDYCAITGIELDAFEVEAIMAMDSAIQKAVAEGDQ